MRGKQHDQRWAKWTAEQHIDEAQRLAQQGHASMANVHATLATQKTMELLRSMTRIRGLAT